MECGFVTDLERFVDEVKDAGRMNSLAQTLMKHTAPGVPDLYQGAELWDLSLVDPDNRRPVDYGLRARLLREIKQLPVAEAADEAMRRADEGLPKLWTIHRALELRREHPESFGAQSAYTPLAVIGRKRIMGLHICGARMWRQLCPGWRPLWAAGGRTWWSCRGANG